MTPPPCESDIDADVDIDHSVTCAICGSLVDERQSISLWEDQYDRREMRMTVAILPDGEAHQSCFNRVGSYPQLVPEEALDVVMEFLRDDPGLDSCHPDSDLAAAITAINLARGEAWPERSWTNDWPEK